MAIFRKVKPIPEQEAEGGIERIYHEFRQIFRVTGVPLLFCHWAGHGALLPLFWGALRPNAETRLFEEASDRLRAEGVRSIAPMKKPDLSDRVRLGESQTYHIRASLDLYHYLYPKLLLLTSAAQLALGGERIGKEGGGTMERIERGAPAGMIAMELAPEEPQDPRLNALFEEIKNASEFPGVGGYLRTLALWPDYLIPAWTRLKPTLAGAEYRQAAERLRESARREARNLPYPVSLSRERVKAAVSDDEEAIALTSRFERAYARAVLHVALLERDWSDPDALTASPFPPSFRRPVAAREERPGELESLSGPAAGGRGRSAVRQLSR